MRRRPEIDLSGLPTHGFGPRPTTWWGTLAFIVLEGTGFAIGAAAYLYLMVLNSDWPLDARPPDLFWSSVVLVIMLASLWPNRLVERNARAEDLPRVRRDLVVLSVIGLALLVLRIFEFAALDISWDRNAYGSLLWLLIGLHTAHLLTDVATGWC